MHLWETFQMEITEEALQVLWWEAREEGNGDGL
jgi:hypothetical protein